MQELVGKIEDRRVVTYGENPQADVRLLDIELAGGVSKFNVLIRDRKTSSAAYIEGLTLPMPGHHNALNATAAIAVAYELGMSVDAIRTGLSQFGGVKRRFTRTGEWNGALVFDDYGHHPVEIAAVLKAARQAIAGTEGARVIAIHQPHRYTRLSHLFEEFCTCFNEADVVAIADVYAAGEEPIPGASRDDLVAGLIAHGHRHARAILDEADLARLFREQARSGDIFVCLGAGTISAWANALPARLLGAAA